MKALEDKCATQEELIKLLGHGRARDGMLLGNMEDGEIEIGQIASLIKDVPTVGDLVKRLVAEQRKAIPENGQFF